MCLSSSSCLPCACCRCQWVWWCCPGCHAESGCGSLSAPLAALPTLARFLLTDEQASSGCSDRPGNLSLKGKTESRKVIPGLAAEVSGHVTESTELVAVPFQIPFYRFTGDAGPDSLTFDLKTEKDKTVHWVVTFMTQGMEDCNKIHINLCTNIPLHFRPKQHPVSRFNWNEEKVPSQTRILGEGPSPSLVNTPPSLPTLPPLDSSPSIPLQCPPPFPSLLVGCCVLGLSVFIAPSFESAHITIAFAVGQTPPVPWELWTFICTFHLKPICTLTPSMPGALLFSVLTTCLSGSTSSFLNCFFFLIN